MGINRRINVIRIITAIILLVVTMLYVNINVYAATSSLGKTSSIDSGSFKSTKITKINIGSDVISIAGNSFSKLYKLKKISVSEKNKNYAAYDGCLYNKDRTKLLCHPQAAVNVDYPDTMVEIADGALAGVVSTEADRAKSALRRNKENASNKADEDTTDEGEETVIPDTQLGNIVTQILSYCSNNASSKEDILRNCYDYILANGQYVRNGAIPVDDWVRHYGYDFLVTGQGNCYGYAAAYAYLAKGIGYETRVATGQLGAARGGLTPHSWCEIKVNDKWYIFDAEMQDAKGKDYYMRTYADYPSSDLYKDKEWFVNW